MKFVELKKFLKQGFYNNYLLYGNDSYLLKKSYELIKESKNFEPELLNISVFTENIDGKEVVKALQTMPIMSEYRLVYVDLSGKTDFANSNEVINYFNNCNPNAILVINAGENKNIYDIFKVANLEVIDCNKLDEKILFAFILNEFKKANKTITPLAMKLLCEFCLYNLTNIVAEIAKLIAFVGERETVEENDVNLIVTKNVDYQIFDLTENLAKKDAQKVYSVLQEIRAKKDNEKLILPLIYSHFRRLLHTKLNSENLTETAKLLKVKEYAVSVALKQSKLFSQKMLKQINDLCLELDYAVKNGDMLNENAIEYLILQILNY